MRCRTLGRTGWQLTGVALGRWEHAPATNDERALIDHALERGVDLIEATELGDKELDELGDQTRLLLRMPEDLSDGSVDRWLEEQRRRIGRERLDLVMVEVPAASGELGQALVEARRRGELVLGLTASNLSEGLATVEEGADVDLLEVPFSLLDQRALAGFEEVERRELGLLVREPLARGVLGGRREELEPPEAMTRAVARAERWARRNRLDLTTAALRFCLSHREVSAVVLAPRSADEVDAAIAAAAADPLPRHKLSDAGPIGVDAAVLRAW